MYIIKKAIPNSELVNAGYVRIKKCRDVLGVNEFVKSVFPHHYDYLVDEYTHDPDKYPVNARLIQSTSGGDWF